MKKFTQSIRSFFNRLNVFARINELSAAIKDLSEENASLRSKISELKEEEYPYSEIHDLSERLDSIRDDLDDLDGRVSDLDDKIDDMDYDDSISDRLDDLENDYSDLDSRVYDLENDEDDEEENNLEERVDSAEERLEKIETQIGDIYSEDLADDVIDLQTKIKNISSSSQIEALTAVMDELKRLRDVFASLQF